MDKVKEGRIEIKVASTLLLIVSIVFLVFDLLITKSFLDSHKELDENAETIILALAYGLTILAFVAAVFGFRETHPKVIITLGAFLLILGIISVIYRQVTLDTIDYVSGFISTLGAVQISGALKISKKVK